MQDHTTKHAPWVAMYGLTEPYGMCQCGCGQESPISTTTNTKVGRSKGKPSRFCHGHNSAQSPVERFWRSVKVVEGGCWEWQAARHAAGYGMMGIGRKVVTTHRYSYELHYGPIPDGSHVCHKCDNPPCCNPEHLFLGTDADNLADMRNKGRGFTPPSLKGTSHPAAKLTEDDIRQIRSRNAGGETGTSLAKEFGISKSNVSTIVLGRTWQHIE